MGLFFRSRQRTFLCFDRVYRDDDVVIDSNIIRLSSGLPLFVASHAQQN